MSSPLLSSVSSVTPPPCITGVEFGSGMAAGRRSSDRQLGGATLATGAKKNDLTKTNFFP